MGFCAIYVLATLIANNFSTAATGITGVWPASGIGLALMLLTPKSARAVVLGSLALTGFVCEMLMHRSVVAALALTTATTLERGLGAWVIYKFCGEPIRFTRVREVVALIGVATLLNAGTACVGAFALMLMQSRSFWSAYSTWWVGNCVSLVVFSSTIVVAKHIKLSLKGLDWKLTAETAVFVVSWLITTQIVVNYRGALLYFPSALLVWPAIRLGRGTTVFALMVLTVQSLIAGQTGNSAFSFGSPSLGDALLRAQFFAGCSSMAALLLCAAVSERDKSQERMLESEQRLTALGDHLPGTMLFQVLRHPDGSMHFLYVSAAVQQIHGLTPEEVYADLGSIYRQIDPAHRAAYAAAEKHSYESRDVFTIEAVFTRPDGSRIFTRITSAPRYLQNGLTVWDGVESDITAQVQAQVDHELLEQELSQAHKLEAVGTLAGGIAHDFNNILAVVIGHAEIALDTQTASSERTESLQQVIRAGLRGRSLVSQILQFSRQEHPDRGPLDLRRETESSVRLLRATIPAGVEIEFSAADAQFVTVANPSEVNQVLLNLCTNAWHSLETSAGRVQIGLERVDIGPSDVTRDPRFRSGPYVRLFVSDNGLGMDDETLKRAFDPFFTTKKASQGTGMGLAVVHGIVSSLDGVIDVQTQLGEGTTISVYLPMLEGPISPSHPMDGESPIDGTGERILYLDDEDSLVMLVTRHLSRRGYQARGFTRAEDALNAIREAPNGFDLLVTDYNMPGMSGIEFGAEAHKVNPDLPVLLTSGYVSSELLELVRENQIRAVFDKPTTASELVVLIQKHLGTS